MPTSPSTVATPVGRVAYRDDDCPVSVKLEAFSPFIPLDVPDSSLPATVLAYTLRNDSSQPVECELHGRMENPVCLYHRREAVGRAVNRVVRASGLTRLECTAVPTEVKATAERPDIVFADFESRQYEGWTAEGASFGAGPVEMDKIPDYQGDVGGQGKRVVNSHASAPGGDVRERDDQTGTLKSDPFVIERNFINFLIGGGAHQGKTCMNLVVDGEVVASATGRSQNLMAPGTFNTTPLVGKTAHLEILDHQSGGWGNIGVDQIVFSDRPAKDIPEFTQLHDFGSVSLDLLADGQDAIASASNDEEDGSKHSDSKVTKPLGAQLIGSVGQRLSLKPGETKTVTFVLAWHFPNFRARGIGGKLVGHSYAARFQNAAEVAGYVAENFERLAGGTRRWVETWYDSTLPYWLLDRTMANTSTLATTTCYRFKDGRFWAWEGIGCCQGTCTHVWHYAQAPGRLFPEIERNHREHVDFGISLHADGGIGMRAGLDGANEAAHDGQCGRILGVLREHQMTADGAFLKRIWPKVKVAIDFLIRQDANDDGMIEGAQPNTLDAAWFGKVSFLASLYLAALRAGEAMADELGDADFVRRCRAISERGARTILDTYDGEYFTQIVDPAHADAIGTGVGCYIDQVFGQTWAHAVGLGRLFDREKQLSALRALWKYNFVPDVGPFRDRFERGRWYAAAGDAGLLMCTWPKGGQNPKAETHWQYMYFNECMSGFEWQAATHMIWEGGDHPDLLEHGLAIARAIHDRYNAALRNPYNEIECSDHYARAMASYGVFLAACGYEYHGPKGHLAFAPRLNPEDFKAAFTAAEGWGTISQRRTDDTQQQRIEVRHGQLRLRSIAFEIEANRKVNRVEVVVAGNALPHEYSLDGTRLTIRLAEDVTLRAGEDVAILVRISRLNSA